MPMRSRPLLLLTMFALLAVLGLSSAAPAQAAGVVGAGTPASCTEAALRAAIAAGGVVSFNCGAAPVTITLADDLLITKDTDIDGGGPVQGGRVTLSGGKRTRVILTSGFALLTVRNLTIADGAEPGTDGRGGAIRGGWRCPVTIINSVLRDNDGTAGDQEGGGGAVFVHETTLTITDSLFLRNRGINGGAINNLLGALSITGSLFEANDSTPGGPAQKGYGGAIYTDGASWPTDDAIGGTIVIRDTVFRGNRGAGQGGAVFSFVYPPDTVTIERVVFENNRVDDNAKCYADGGCDALGGALRHGNGDLFLRDSLFVGNSARSQGGAFWAGETGRWQLTNVTFAQNQAVHDATTGQGGLGGAIAGGSAWTCTNCTFVQNHAGFVGGAIFGGDTSNSTLQNSLFAANTAFNDGKGWNKQQACGMLVHDGGGNVQDPPRNAQDSSDVNCVAAPLLNDPLVAALDDYGGPTRTVAIGAGSPARGVGVSCPATDQRGVARPATGCDSGAYQTGTVPVLTGVTPSLVQRDTAATLTVSGADFTSASEVLWDGVPLVTSYVSPIQLTAELPAARTGAGALGEVRVRTATTTSPAARSVTLVAQVGWLFLPVLSR